MEGPHANPTAVFGKPLGPFRGPFVDAVRYWEARRLLYNLVLAVVTVAWVAATWPHFRTGLTLSSLPPMAVLALLANICYCAAYIVETALLHSSFEDGVETPALDPMVNGNSLCSRAGELLDR